MENSYKFFNNHQCQFFPCHQGIKTEEFNCLFCYCPLYHLENCGGNYKYLKNNIKECTNCTKPHSKNSYENVMRTLLGKD